MPLDPLIVNSPKLDLGDPVADYTNYLRASQFKATADKARQAQDANNMINALYKKHTDEKGSVNFNGLAYDLAQNNFGTSISGVRKTEGEQNKLGAEVGHINSQTANENAQTGKYNAEAFKQAYENHNKKLSDISTDPTIGIPQLVHWKLDAFSDPIMGPMLRAQGKTPEQEVERLKATLKSMPYEQFLLTNQIGPEAASKQHIEVTDLGDRKVTRATNEHSIGAPQQTTLSTDKIHESPDAKYKGTHVNVQVPVSTQVTTSAGKKFGEVVEEEQGKEFAALDHLNASAPAEIAATDKTLKMLQSGNVITGFGADQQATLLSMAKALRIPVNNETLKNTQLLRQAIGRNLMGRIASYKSQGISLTPMSNLDLENFQKTGPQMFDDPATLVDSFKNYRQSIADGVSRYNTLKNAKMGSPVVGNMMHTVYQPQPATAIPPAPGQQSWPVPPKANIDRLRANPGERAIFEKHYGPGSAKRYAGI